MTLTTHKIDLEFQLGEGSFGETGANALTVSGLRVAATISKAGGASMSELRLQVWGLRLDVMQRLTVLNKLAYSEERNNTVTVIADGAIAFVGTIKEAWADASSPPDMLFTLSAYTAGLEAVRPVTPTSFNGPVGVDVVMASIGAQMVPPRSLENNGVTATLDSPYLPGSLRDQAMAAARAARCEIVIEDQAIAIWPVGQARNAAELIVSPDTGMVGYPRFTQNGIVLQFLYTPSLTFGQTLQVQSSLGAANGKWAVAAVTHDLAAEMPGGPWFTTVECYLFGHAAPIVGTPGG